MGINASVAYLLIDKNGIVLDVTSSKYYFNFFINSIIGSIQLLDIDKQKMLKRRIKYDLTLLLPSVFNGD